MLVCLFIISIIHLVMSSFVNLFWSSYWFFRDCFPFLKKTCGFCITLIMDMLLIFFYRSWRFRPPKLASMAMLNVTLLRLIFSTAKSLKILFLLPTTVMYEVFLSNWFYMIFQWVFITGAFSWFKCLFPLHCRFPMSPELTTSWLISQRMDLYVS